MRMLMAWFYKHMLVEQRMWQEIRILFTKIALPNNRGVPIGSSE